MSARMNYPFAFVYKQVDRTKYMTFKYHFFCPCSSRIREWM